MNFDTISEWVKTDGLEWLKTDGVKFATMALVALAIFLIGKWLARRITDIVKKGMAKANMDETLISFLGNGVYMILMVCLVLIVLDYCGIRTTSFVAILGAAGLAVGLALQGSLANFASGVLIIMFRPFKKGDFIDGGGVMGVVEGITILTTNMTTPDNKVIIVPNSQIMGGPITNFSAKDTRRIDFVFGVGYDDDLKKVKKVLTEILEADERVLKDPAPTIGLSEMADSSINFVCRPWVKSCDYWQTFWDINERVKLRFDEEGISIPYPQRDIHVIDGGNKETLAS